MAGSFHVIKQPAQLGCREIGVEQQAGSFADPLFKILVAQLATRCGGSSVLPDNGVVYRHTGRPIPDHDCFSLVGDADCGYVAAAGRERLAAHCTRGLPDFLRVMLDQAVGRIDLRERLLRFRYDIVIVIKNNGPGTGSTLINREDVGRSVHTAKEECWYVLYKGFRMAGSILLL